MRIRDARRTNSDPSPTGFTTVARFALEPIDGVVLYDCRLVQAPSGKLLVYGPPVRSGGDSMSLAPDIRHQIIDAMRREVLLDEPTSQYSAA